MFAEDRLELFQGMLLCCHDLYLWIYDEELNLIRSNCPDAASVGGLFTASSVREPLLDSARRHSNPIIMSSDLGNQWVAVPEKEDGVLRRVYILGPFFTDAVTEGDMEKKLRDAQLSPTVRKSAVDFLRRMPVISLSRIYEYTIMLYYCLTGKKISVSDLHYQESEARPPRAVDQGQIADAHGTYEMEREMVRMVREGDLNFQRHMSKLAVSGSLGKLSNGDPLRQMKNAVLVCVVLFSRAAIEGGLSPELSMTLTDQFFQSVEACRSISELHEIATTMQNDFVQRVHRVRAKEHSRLIMECCDYIQLHVEEDLSLKQIAEALKYSEYYLSRKFKEEMGVTFREYLRGQKLERAKALLRDNSLTVRDISEKLHFCSQSYFTESFRAAYGISPSQWREQ